MEKIIIPTTGKVYAVEVTVDASRLNYIGTVIISEEMVQSCEEAGTLEDQIDLLTQEMRHKLRKEIARRRRGDTVGDPYGD